MLGAIQRSPALAARAPVPPAAAADGMKPPEQAPAVVTVPVKALGLQLMADYVVPLEVLGLLLTAAMIGAVIIALPERPVTSHRGKAEELR
jgi:NADH:ubiquinone oxidoreductase subunit 6 (subunit J)